MSLTLLTPGWATRIVDLGRPRTRSLGVPLGGAGDRASLTLGNALVGNPANSAALEICVKGPTVRAECNLACVVFGAPFEVRTGEGEKGRKGEGEFDPTLSPLLPFSPSPLPPFRTGVTFTLHQGEELQIAGTPRGMTAYLCVGGGLMTQEILGSRSSLGTLQARTVLPCQPGTIHRRFFPPGVAESWNESGPIRVVPGLQAEWFDLPEFLANEYVAASASDRMGLRLKNKPLSASCPEMTSEPVCPGAVQVTRDGQCIILGVDGQTIGGYPKIVQVIAADLDRLAQIRPGQHMQFALIGLDEATDLFERRKQELAEWSRRARYSL